MMTEYSGAGLGASLTKHQSVHWLLAIGVLIQSAVGRVQIVTADSEVPAAALAQRTAS